MMNEQYYRPASFADVVSLVRSLNNKDVPYLLIGGYGIVCSWLSLSVSSSDGRY